MKMYGLYASGMHTFGSLLCAIEFVHCVGILLVLEETQAAVELSEYAVKGILGRLNQMKQK